MAENDDDDAVAAAIMHLYSCKSKQKNVIKVYFHQFRTVLKQAKNNELQTITTFSIDHVLPIIDLEIEHVL